MAKQGITDIHDGVNALFNLVEFHYTGKANFVGQPYTDFVGERVALKGRLFNTILNDKAILEHVEAKHLREAADRYERGKNGNL